MIQKFNKDYYIGLDLGTNSVGWALTDENYNLLRFNKKDMWGSRLFSEAKSSEERRKYRSSRRNLNRKKWRIDILRSFFKDEIDKIDDKFFMRLDESNLYLEDKTIKEKFTLFNDKNYKDINFYKEYKTIYHLRDSLVNEKGKKDIRLIYLAIHHIFKNRGHFLFENLGNDEIGNFDNIYEELKDYLLDKFNIDSLDDKKDKVKEILYNKEGKKNKKSKIKEIFEKNSKELKIFNFIIGDSLKLVEIFEDENLKKEVIKDFNNYEENKREEYLSILGDEIILIDICKKFKDAIILKEILKEGKYISESMKNIYDKHNQDLKELKYFVKKYDNKRYNEFFRGENSVYSNYINYTKFNGNKKEIKKIKTDEKKTKFELLTKYFKEFFKNIKDNITQDEKEIFDRLNLSLESNNILPKLRTSNNSIIPYQIHKKELLAIIDNQAKYYSFLEKYRDKIIKAFEFKIPYYVGPLNPKSKFSWIYRSNDEKITPWNFEEVVNIEKSAEIFIERMINNGVYLKTEKVMPKNSLIYEEYSVLNELNKIKINGKLISVELKNRIFNEVFKYRANVTMASLIEFFKINNLEVKKENISGIAEDKFNSNYSTYIKFKKIFGDDIEKDFYKEMIENIIIWKCLYGSDNKIFINKFKSVYKDFNLDDAKIKEILKLKFSGFGRLSRKLLTEIEFYDKKTGDVYSSVMNALRETNYNLMELLSSRFSLNEEIEKYDDNLVDEVDLRKEENINKLLDELYVSPLIKRSITQTIKILNELTSITKKDPKRIFVEVAKGGRNKKTNNSRKEALKKLLENISDSDDIKKEFENIDNDLLRQKKLYLYFMQLGRCIYSNEKIDINDLMDSNKYDIDHLYPQSVVKDDSFDNTVLTKKPLNLERGDTYPIKPEVQAQMHKFWEFLRSKKFMSSKKYARLMDKETLSSEKLEGFIQRQLVSLRQSTKEMIKILKIIFPETEIVYSKASTISSFREKFDLPKSRELNDFHHAKDAYLNIVVGNIIYNKFTKRFYLLKKNKLDEENKFNFKDIFDSPVYENDKRIWDKENILESVKKIYGKNTINLTQKLAEDKGQLFKLTINKKGKPSSDYKVPVKVENTIENAEKYGYYYEMEASYFAILEVTDNKGKVKKIVDRVLVMDRKKLSNKEEIENYFNNKLKSKYKEIKFVCKIKKNQLIEYKGYPYRIVGLTGEKTELKNAKPLFLDNKFEKIVINVSKLLEKNLKDNEKLILQKLRRKSDKEPVESYDECFKRYNLEFDELYCVLLQKIKSNVYKNYFNSEKIYEFMTDEKSKKKNNENSDENSDENSNEKIDKKKIFTELSLRNKALVLKSILKGLSKETNCGSAEIEKYNIYDTRIRKGIDFVDFYLIHESVTGLFNKKIKI